MKFKNNQPNSYDIEASNLLAKMEIEFKTVFLFHGPFWESDKECRNVWELTLTRPARNGKTKTASFRFGQSITDSFRDEWEGIRQFGHQQNHRSNMIPTQKNIPTVYEVLASITKSDPGTFNDFCAEFGMDTDSRKAERTYFAVQEEWQKVRGFFTSEEIELIQEIN